MDQNEKRSRAGLAGRLVRLTLTIVVVSLIAVGVASALGAYELAEDRFAARHEAFLQIIANEVTQRLVSAADATDRFERIVARSPHGEIDRLTLAQSFEQSSELLDSLIISDAEGRVLSAYPAFLAPREVQDSVVLSRTVSGDGGLLLTVGRDEITGPILYSTRRVEREDGEVQLIIARVRTGFLGVSVGQVASAGSNRAAFIVDGNSIVVAGDGGPGISASLISYDETGDHGIGMAQAMDASGEYLVGHWTDIRAPEELGWRVLILEPESLIFEDTARAVVPVLVVMLFAGFIAVGLSWFAARRLVQPLKSVESAALDAAAGAYVRPLPVVRDDEVGRLAGAFNAVALRLNALHDLSQLLASSSRLDQVLDGILSAMGHIVGPGSIVVYLLDEEGTRLIPSRSRGLFLAQAAELPVDGVSWPAEAVRLGEMLTFSVVAQDIGEALPGFTAEGRVSALVAPLVLGIEVLGVVVVLQSDRGDFTEAEMEIVRTFSAQAALAVNNSRLFVIESESRRAAEALRILGEELSRFDELAQALDGALRMATSLLHATAMRLCVFEPNLLGLDENDSQQEAMIEAARAVIAPVGPRATLVQAGHDDAIDELLREEGAHTVLFVPVAWGTQHPAVLVAFHDDEGGFKQRDIDLADTIANQLSLALDNAFLFERAMSRAANLETIFRISQAVGSSLQIKVVLNRVLDVVQKILSADAVSLMSFDSDKRRVTTAMARGVLSSEMLYLEVEIGEDVPGEVFASGEPVSLPVLDGESGGVPALAVAAGLNSMLAVPLLARGRSIGVLSVFSAEPNTFSSEDLGLLHTFASQAALAIDTASLYSHEHEVAQILQASILPESLPEYEEIRSDSVYVAAGDEVDIGGDYYDIFRGPEGSIFITIGDVCGKGVVAATKTSMIKYALRALVAAGFGPGRCMTEVNRMVAETGDTSDIVTLWCGRYEARSGTLTWANGGHPPGMLRRADDAEIVHLATTGPLLGALMGVTFEESSLIVGEGDTLLLYTDGVTEARQGNRFFGEGRVQRSLRYGGEVSDITHRLMSAVRRFVTDDLRDDVAIVAIQFMEQSDEEGHSE